MIGFLVKAGLFYIVWQVVYDLVIYPDGRLDQFLAVSVAILAKNALALFGLAKENSELETVEKNVKDLSEVYQKNKDLGNFVTNPTRSFEEHFQVINKLNELMDFSPTFVKNDTVIGIIGNTQGVSKAKNPILNANRINENNPS